MCIALDVGLSDTTPYREFSFGGIKDEDLREILREAFGLPEKDTFKHV